MMKYFRTIIIFMFLFFSAIGFCLAFTLEEEISVGKSASCEYEKTFGVTYKREYAARIQKIVSRLYRVAPRKEVPYEFKILDTDVFNACAFPGGFIYINRGLMDACSDGELAFIISHEMAHCAHSHSFGQAEKSKALDFGTLAASILLKDTTTDILIKKTTELARTVITTKFSRNDEKQADEDAVSYMCGAGFNPQNSINAFKKMKKLGGGMPGFLNTLVGTHPIPDERIKYVTDLINKKFSGANSLKDITEKLNDEDIDEVDTIIGNMKITAPAAPAETPPAVKPAPKKENKNKK